MARNGRKRVWRGVRRGALFVGLGFITSAVVAWAIVLVPIAIWGNNRNEKSIITANYYETSVREVRRLGYERIGVYWSGWLKSTMGNPQAFENAQFSFPGRPDSLREFGMPAWTMHVLGDELQKRDEIVVLQVGWPMRCFGCCAKWYGHAPSEFRTNTFRSNTLPRVIGGLTIPEVNRGATGKRFVFFEYPRARELPAIPLFPGFIVNTLFYAALWFGIVTGWRALKRKWRMHRGRCPKCKYDLARDFSTGCPECGWRRETTPRPVSF